jgi:integrase
MRVKLKGIHSTTKRLADGSKRVYFYAWKGGPRLDGKPGTPAFMAAYNRAIADLKKPDPRLFFNLIAEYRASTEFTKLSPQAQKDYRRYLSLIENEFGDLPVAALHDPAVRGEFKIWRDKMASTPRTADFAVSVLAKVLAVAEDNGRITHNYAAKISRLYVADRADKIWSEADIGVVLAKADPTISNVFLLAISTGLRQGDLLRLTWTAYDGGAINRKTSKTGAYVRIPLLSEARATLDGLKRTSTHILTNQYGRPWTSDGFRSSFDKFKRKHFPEVDLHFHDTRGTAITRLRLADCSNAEIGAITGHSQKTIEQVLKAHYMGDQTPLAERAIRRLENERRLKSTNQ